jgi:hypothetical protein
MILRSFNPKNRDYSNRKEYKKNEDVKGFCYAFALVCLLSIVIMVLEYNNIL